MRFWSRILLVALAMCSPLVLSGCGSSQISEEDAAAQEKAEAAASQSGDNASDGGGKKRPEPKEAE